MQVFYFHDEMINEDVLKAGLRLAKEQAQNGEKHISVFVNVISGMATDQFTRKMFNQTEVNKLRNGKIINSDGISIKLESPKTFEEYNEYEVILGLHLSTSSLNTLEKCKNIKKIIILVETQDVNHEWLTKVNATQLTYK
ncbi:hypothetical protein [Acinetobacter modestus]|uniref:hypothetical protein n=1 Tax=Acinetobacter modestus TaxID=1776740 RepID=UPI00320B5798